MRYPQEHVVLKGDVCEGPVHQDHLCVLNMFPYLQQQEHSPAVQVWGPRAKLVMMCPKGTSNLRATPLSLSHVCGTHRLCS